MAIDSVYKSPLPRGYSKQAYYIEDKSETSPYYFDITYMPMVMSGGKSIITFRGNGLNLRQNSTIDAEIIDAEGNNIYYEFASYIDRFNNFHITVEIYDITPQGVATIYLVGEANVDMDGRPIPQEFRDRYNVRWSKTFNVLPSERNNAALIFDKPPKVSVTQVVTPARLSTNTSVSGGYSYTVFTSSMAGLTIQSANFEGYDRDFGTNVNILDERLKSILVNPDGTPKTMNSVNTYIREKDTDVQSGFKLNLTTRFNTFLIASSSLFKKEHLGGYFEFFDSASIPTSLLPEVMSGTTVSGSTAAQLSTYNAAIVEVLDDTKVLLSTPVEVITLDSRSPSADFKSVHRYKQSSVFTASIAYVPSDMTYVTSSTVSQSYVELTFYDLNPISGEVYRIKTYAKPGAVTGDYKLISDQIVRPTEYLTDAKFPNQANYTKHESDYLMIGHFTSKSIVDDYWLIYQESLNGFDPITGSLNSSSLMESVPLIGSYTQSAVFSTAYYQNYNVDQRYTLSFYAVLEPYTELEVYMGSDPLNTHLLMPAVSPRAFLKTENKEKTRYPENLNRFGKYLGKVVNNTKSQKYYGKIMYDFSTDASGFGRPVFRSKVIGYTDITGSAYVSEVSIKPFAINGFTPKIFQYAIPLDAKLEETLTLSQSIDFKIDYFDYTGKQSEYVTFLDDIIVNLKVEIPSNTCQEQTIQFDYNSAITSDKN